MIINIFKIRTFTAYSSLFITLGLISLFTGCNGDNAYEGIADTSTKDSKLEEVRILMNDRNYKAAIDILEKLNQNDTSVLRPLAGAYAGRAGYETIALLKAVSLLQDPNDKGESTIDIIAYMMLGGKTTITQEELDFAIKNLTYSIFLYEKYLSIDPDTTGVVTQLGFVSLAHFTYLLVELMSMYQEEIGHTGDIIFSEEGIHQMYIEDGFIFPPGYEEILDAMSQDLRRMNDALIAFGELYDGTDKIMEEINAFLDKVDNGMGDESVPRDNILTEDEFLYYLEHIN